MQDLNKLAGIGTSTLAIPSETTRLYGFRRQLYAYRQSRIEHKSYREIAAVLGVCAARVGQLVKRAEQQMSRMEAPPGGYTQVWTPEREYEEIECLRDCWLPEGAEL